MIVVKLHNSSTTVNYSTTVKCSTTVNCSTAVSYPCLHCVHCILYGRWIKPASFQNIVRGVICILKGYSSSHDQVVLDIRQRC